MTDYTKALTSVRQCTDTQQLENWIANARRQGAAEVEQAAIRQLISLVPSENPGTLEHDFWKSIRAFEFARSEINGRKTYLNRTRQKVKRVGILQTLIDMALQKKESEGFNMLVELNMPELMAEAIILRHPDSFDDDVKAAARHRLETHDIAIEPLLTVLMP